MNFKFSKKNGTALYLHSKERIILVIILAIIFWKWYINGALFRIGGDVSRHLELIDLIMKYGKITYFYQDGTSIACPYYPPGFHILISQLSIISGVGAPIIMNILSLIFFILFVTMVFAIGKIILKDAKKAIVLPFIAAIFSSSISQTPMSMCICIFFPLLIYLCLRYISQGKKQIVLLISITMISLTFTHFSYAVFLIIIIIAMIISIIFINERRTKSNFLDIWIISIISFFIGFSLYNPLTPNLITSIKSITVSWLYSSSVSIDFILKHPKLVMIGILLVSIGVYLIIRRTLIKNSINRNVSKFFSKLFSIIISINSVLLTVFAISSIALLFLQYFIVYFVKPLPPFCGRKIAFDTMSSIIGFGKSAFTTFISPNNIGFSILAILALIEIRRKIKGGNFWNKNNILLVSFMIPFISLMFLALFHNSFLTNSPIAGRMPSYAFLPILFFSSYALFNFIKNSKLKRGLLVIFIIFVAISSTLQPIFNECKIGYNKGLAWLIKNTPIRKETFSYDQRGYYHISIIPKLYKFKMKNLQIYASLLKNDKGEYTPLLSLKLDGYKRQLHLSGMKWKPMASRRKLDNKIYANDEITFWHKNR